MKAANFIGPGKDILDLFLHGRGSGGRFTDGGPMKINEPVMVKVCDICGLPFERVFADGSRGLTAHQICSRVRHLEERLTEAHNRIAGLESRSGGWDHAALQTMVFK